jgi:hypothetical protein
VIICVVDYNCVGGFCDVRWAVGQGGVSGVCGVCGVSGVSGVSLYRWASPGGPSLSPSPLAYAGTAVRPAGSVWRVLPDLSDEVKASLNSSLIRP